ncbi:hypothetical protein TREPR_3885 [Treponema primitia ZAS-2]|uniref:Uncharacterized protein n=1 Tax=Treponema primitia (strain ATCC BAA-887 / DSM 12427 / ZAS-2) TaxID=545694 RepID=F5YP11_TREPZ|nr:hypothetical protein TREPR_3885 [Treponema primitia ZAS-2]
MVSFINHIYLLLSSPLWNVFSFFTVLHIYHNAKSFLLFFNG